MDDVISADSHIRRIQRARRYRQHGCSQQPCRKGQTDHAAQNGTRSHPQYHHDGIADYARQHVIRRKQKGQSIKQIHVNRMNLRRIQPVHLYQTACIRLTAGKNNLR